MFTEDDKMKEESPDILAFAFGLAAIVFTVKGLLVIFWQCVPIFGWIWLGVAAVTGILCVWTLVRCMR